jgi:hypothetical protein
MKELFLPFRLVSCVNVQKDDGTWYCHLLVDDTTVKELEKAGAISDWSNAPTSYKAADGTTPLHEYLGHDVTKMGVNSVGRGDPVPVDV